MEVRRELHPLGERAPGTHWIQGYEEELNLLFLSGIEPQFHDRPASSESVYRIMIFTTAHSN
jgi:hypothetical protein